MDERDKGGLLYVESQRGHYSISGRCFANTPENSLIKEFVTRVDSRLRRLRGWKDDQAVSLEVFRNLVLAALAGEEWDLGLTAIAMAAGDRKKTEALAGMAVADTTAMIEELKAQGYNTDQVDAEIMGRRQLFRVELVGHLGSPKVNVSTHHGQSTIIDAPPGFPHMSHSLTSGRARSLAHQMARAG
ncbi:MAG: hypothetical protein Q8Q00_07560 [Dehalococcoidia bacterium]|nr:hypothetical protein [Dehalococcoidia bacterium]